ncbi:efflux RND transporter periplasmic adaptor subunit [Horticoccus sp. 23ND18S-11]|uniref:efflux RND transporter periplasmic adaptor subunit n=1 Tax=Horticoccus sp. 23ND18S-11 TaxID=3391832 RepID=UPI0039C8ED81
MLKKVIIYTLTVIGLVLIVLALGGTKILQFKSMGAAGAAYSPPPEIVTASPVVEQAWEKILTATGSVAAVQGVTVGAEMAGKVEKIAFVAGATVAAGDLLVQLDVSNELAQLRSAEAASDLAKLNLDRAKSLREKDSNSAADLDIANAQAKQAAAAADSLRAIIAKKTIRAPFAGRLGLRLVNLGQILKDGEAITTLQTMDPIYVNFSLPQQRLSAISVGDTVRVASNALADELIAGKITAIAPEVDPATRNVRVQATLGNSAERLRPGMFATVTIVLPEKSTNLIIPATAILYAPYGDSVFVVDEKKNEKSGAMEKVLRQQFIRLGPARGDFVTVETGLKVGETVVTTGAFKLRPGMAVVIDNKLAPDAKLAPKPDNS